MIGNKKIKHIVIKAMLITKKYTNIIEHQMIKDDQKQFFSKILTMGKERMNPVKNETRKTKHTINVWNEQNDDNISCID